MTKVSLQYNSQTCHSDLHHRPCLPHNTESLPGERWKGWGGEKTLFVTMETPLKSEVFHLKKIGGEGEFFTLEILLYSEAVVGKKSSKREVPKTVSRKVRHLQENAKFLLPVSWWCTNSADQTLQHIPEGKSNSWGRPQKTSPILFLQAYPLPLLNTYNSLSLLACSCTVQQGMLKKHIYRNISLIKKCSAYYNIQFFKVP